MQIKFDYKSRDFNCLCERNARFHIFIQSQNAWNMHWMVCMFVCVCKWGILQSNNEKTHSHACKVIKPISLPCWCIFFYYLSYLFIYLRSYFHLTSPVFLSSCALFTFTYDIYLWVAIFFHLYFFLFCDYSCEKGKCSWRFFRESMGLSWPILNESLIQMNE